MLDLTVKVKSNESQQVFNTEESIQYLNENKADNEIENHFCPSFLFFCILNLSILFYYNYNTFQNSIQRGRLYILSENYTLLYFIYILQHKK